MTEPTPTPDGVTPDGTAPADEPKPITAEDLANVTAALEKERGLRKQRDAELKQFQTQAQASMTDTERAIAEAREQAAAEVRSQYGQRLAQTEFKAAAAAANPEYDAAKALKYVNLASFVGEDGEPDAKAIAAAVADLIPASSNTPPAPPSFDGGTRQTAQSGPSMTQLIRQAAGRA